MRLQEIKTIRWIPALLILLSSAQNGRAHLPIATNVLVDIEIKGELLVVQPWIPTFMLPPLKDVRFENDAEWPFAEERRAAIEDYFHEICPIEIDGKPMRPQLESLKLQPMKQAKHLGEIIDFVVARIVLHYPSEQPPQKVRFRWGIYPPVPEGGWGEMVDADQDPQEFDLMMFVDNKEDFVFFSPAEPEFLWHRKPGEVPLLDMLVENYAKPIEAPRDSPDGLGASIAILSLVMLTVGAFQIRSRPPIGITCLVIAGIAALVGAKLDKDPPGSPSGITSSEAVKTFKTLQANLYSAFDFETEDEVYDVLAQSVDGALLDDIYEEVYRSLIVVDKSSAVCKVHKVDVLESDATPIDPGSDGRSEKFDIACHWRVHGVVEHHAHIHRRVNEYRAKYRLSRGDEGWKITGVSVAQQDRLDPKTLKKSEDY